MGAEQRRTPRNKTYAKVLIEDRQAQGYLRDLSREGCQLALLEELDIERGDRLRVTVLPGEEIGIRSFSLSTEIMWRRSDPVYLLVGARILSAEGEEAEQRLARLFGYYS